MAVLVAAVAGGFGVDVGIGLRRRGRIGLSALDWDRAWEPAKDQEWAAD